MQKSFHWSTHSQQVSWNKQTNKQKNKTTTVRIPFSCSRLQEALLFSTCIQTYGTTQDSNSRIHNKDDFMYCVWGPVVGLKTEAKQVVYKTTIDNVFWGPQSQQVTRTLFLNFLFIHSFLFSFVVHCLWQYLAMVPRLVSGSQSSGLGIDLCHHAQLPACSFSF